MRAIIIATPGFREMAGESARRLDDYGDTDSIEIIRADSKPDCHLKKLSMLLEYREPVCLVDADWWMIRSTSLPKVSGELVVTSPCHGVDHLYEGTPVPPGGAFCSCFVALDMGAEAIRNAVREAIRLQRQAFPNGEPKADERFLNIALYSDAYITVACLSSAWNWCGDAPHSRVIAVHAAIEKNDKLAWLRRAASRI